MSEDRFPVEWCREQFPALKRELDGKPVVYLDGPAGSQVPQCVIDAIAGYLVECNANHGGRFATSRESDAMLARAHEAVADLLGAKDAGATVFGANMTSLTFAFSRSLAREWKSGDEVVVTRLDHDANVNTWAMAARDVGAKVRYVSFRPGDCTLDLDELRAALGPRTRLVAVGCASNAVGTINPIAEIVRMSHDAGALVFLDTVHYAPHALVDVETWGCDFLACSAYKFFGPHVGILWGRPELLRRLVPYKVRPAADDLPDRWMTGTQSHEGIAGTLAAVEYLASLGRRCEPAADNRRAALAAAYRAISRHENQLCRQLLAGLARIPDVKVWGITDAARLDDRVPTVSITHGRRSPIEMADLLAARGIFAWHGNFYALELSESLGLEPEGLLRLGLLHYNTGGEVERLLEALAEL